MTILKDSNPQKKISDKFYLDSGASNHVCGDWSLFQSLHPVEEPLIIETASGEATADYTGTIICTSNEIEIELKDVLYYAGAPNLLSVSKLTSAGCEVKFSKIHLKSV